ncbi:MAG: FtsX-like permease family protein [Sphingomonadaceae bacterium]
MSAGGVRLAMKLALREARGGPGALRLLFVCLLLGVFALAGVGSLESAIRAGLAAEGQTLLGGDVEARLTQMPPSAEQRATIMEYGETSESVRMRAMLHSTDRQLLAELKAVDGGWPLYGEARLADGGGNAEVHSALGRGVVVSTALAEQLGLHVGDEVRLGEARFPVSGILTVEPDRAGQGFTLGPTVLLARDKLPGTGLMQPGSLYSWHVRVKLPVTTDPAVVIAQLEAAFPDAGWRLTDRDNAAPGVRRFVGRLGQFLTLVSLTALAVAGVGVGNGVRAWLDTKNNTIATLKTLGASSRLIILTYLLLIGGVALLAALIGAAAGTLVPWLVARLAGDALPAPTAAGLYPAPLLVAICYGLLVALIFAIPPLARAGALPVQRILRGGAEAWPWPSARARTLSGGIVALVAGLAIWQAHDAVLAAIFLAGAGGVLALLYGLGALMQLLAARLPRPRRLLPRLALANLHRPGAMTRQLVVALGLGLSLFACLALVETGFRHELQRSLPAQAPAFFLLDLPKEDEERLAALLPANTDIQFQPSLRGPITAVNDVRASELTPPEGAWILRGDRGLTWSRTLPEGNRLVEGEWWPEDYAGPPLVSMDAEQAGLLGIELGDTITVSVLGVELTATVASLREIDWDSLGFNFAMVFDPASLAGAPYSLMATVSPPVEAEAGFTARISNSFPTVSVIRVKDVLDRLSGIVGQTGVAVRVAASIAILAGIAVLIGALTAQAQARTADHVILKTLGATRRQLLAIAALEYAALGLIVALLALALGGLAAWVALTQILEFGWHPDWGVATLTVAAGGLVTMMFGLAGAARTLGVPVAQALRAA